MIQSRADDIARLQVLMTAVRELDPSNEALHSAVCQRWQNCHYSLTQRQYRSLVQSLESALKTIHKEKAAAQFEQHSLFG